MYRTDDNEAKDKDMEIKQKRTDYADTRRGAKESDLHPGDIVLLKQKKEDKLSTEFQSVPYEVMGKHGNEVSNTSADGVSYRRNVTDVKKYRSKTDYTSVSEDESSVIIK